MTALLDALARTFVTPRAAGAPAREAVVAAAPAAAICGPDAEPLACALALMLRRRGPVVACIWGSVCARRPEAPATAAARRLAGSLSVRGLSARATGRLVAVALDQAAEVAAAQAARAAAAAGDAALVIALCGPRQDAFEALLGVQDVVVVAAGDAPDGLVGVALAALEDVSRRAVAARRLTRASGWAARAGLWAAPGARRALADALGGSKR
jgi:hypothetical protein